MSGLFHWAGGKGRIVDALISHIVPNARTFCPPCATLHPAPNWIEPFVGGGAVALEAMRRGLAARYVLADGSTVQGLDAGHEDGVADPSGQLRTQRFPALVK